MMITRAALAKGGMALLIVAGLALVPAPKTFKENVCVFAPVERNCGQVTVINRWPWQPCSVLAAARGRRVGKMEDGGCRCL